MYLFDTFGEGDIRNKVTDVFIRNILSGSPITIPENEVNIKMSLTAPGCPVAGEMPGWVGEAIEPLAGVKQVDVDLIWEPPWGMDMMSDEARLELGFM